MQDLTFIIPIRVDTEDRLDNCLTVLKFLQLNFESSEVLLMEQDSEVRTQRITAVFPSVRHHFELNTGRFSKARAINDGMLLAAGALVCMCDTDILLHPKAITLGCHMLRQNPNRVIIPHNRIFVDVSGDFKAKIAASLDMNKYGKVRRFADAPRGCNATSRDCNGGIFMAARATLLHAGGINKKMISYGWEDTEFIRRMDRLGIYTFMFAPYNLVHLDHRRGPDSQINEMFDVNRAEFEKVNAMTCTQLEKYVDEELDIAPVCMRATRPAFRKSLHLMNLLTLQKLAHIFNKVHINLQINGAAKFLRRHR